MLLLGGCTSSRQGGTARARGGVAVWGQRRHARDHRTGDVSPCRMRWRGSVSVSPIGTRARRGREAIHPSIHLTDRGTKSARDSISGIVTGNRPTMDGLGQIGRRARPCCPIMARRPARPRVAAACACAAAAATTTTNGRPARERRDGSASGATRMFVHTRFGAWPPVENTVP